MVHFVGHHVLRLIEQSLGFDCARARSERIPCLDCSRSRFLGGRPSRRLTATSDAGRLSVLGFDGLLTVDVQLALIALAPDPGLVEDAVAVYTEPIRSNGVQDRRAMPLVSGFGPGAVRAETLVQ